MFNPGFVSPMVTENATSVIPDLMQFYTNQTNIQDNVNRIIGEREQLLAAAAKLSDLEHRAKQLEIDRHQLSSVETDRRIVAEERELVSLHRGILSKDQEDHRLAVALPLPSAPSSRPIGAPMPRRSPGSAPKVCFNRPEPAP